MLLGIWALCKLVASSVPEVQHAAALHLATLTKSAAVQKAFGQNAHAVYALHEIEERTSQAFGKPGNSMLEREASQFARWALRTPRGRNYKPDLTPKTKEELEADGAVAIQARVRSSFVAQGYRKEMAQRKAAATILQSGFRGHQDRAAMAAEMLVMAPAAALLQG